MGTLPAAFSQNALKPYQENVVCRLHEVAVVGCVRCGRGIVICRGALRGRPAALLPRRFTCLLLVGLISGCTKILELNLQ